MFSLGFFVDLQISLIVLWAIYYFAIHNRVRTAVARTIILLIVPFSLAISLTKIPLQTVKEYVELPVDAPSAGVQDFPAVVSSFEGDAMQDVGVFYVIDKQGLNAQWLYAVGVVVMILWLLVGLFSIFSTILFTKIEKIFGHSVIFLRKRAAAYSFFNYIFINSSLRSSPSLRLVILHEAAHSKYCHSVDLSIMLLCRALLWFNPVVWHLTVLLKRVHEYQVDNSIVRSGASIKEYLNLLIEADYSRVPPFVHSFSYSVTKKRLLMITNTFPKRSALRALLVLPALSLLTFAFAVTTEINTVFLPKEETAAVAAPQSNETPKIAEKTEQIAKEKKRESAVIERKYFTVLNSEQQIPVIFASDNSNFEKLFKNITGKEMNRQLLVSLSPSRIGQIKLLSSAQAKKIANVDGQAIYITLRDEDDRDPQGAFGRILEIGGESYRARVGEILKEAKPTVILEKSNGDFYPARYPLSTAHQTLPMTVNKELIKNINTISAAKAVAKYGIAGINGATIISLKPFEGALNKVLPTNTSLSEEDQLFSFVDRLDCYILKPEQIREYKGVPDFRGVVSLRNTDTETIVTVALPISWDAQWHAPNATETILLDPSTGDRYHYRRMEGVPNNKVLIIKGMNGKIVEMDYVFPRLKDGVEQVILTHLKAENYEYPLNRAITRDYVIDVQKFLNRPQPNEYR